MNDLVSIGLPTRNNAKMIRTALDSLLAQTYSNIELIISDNASTDNTREICEEYAAKDKRIRFTRQKENIDGPENFRFVLSQASGKYFMWAADDDWWDPKFIVVMKNFLDAHPSHGAAMCSYSRFYNDNGEFIRDYSFAGKNDVSNLGYAKVLEMMTKKSPLHKFLYALFRTEMIKKISDRPFPKCIAFDRVIMSEIALTTHFYSHPEILYKVATYRTSLIKRHGAVGMTMAWLDHFHYNKYVYTTIGRLWTSPVAPFYRKIAILPYVSAKLLWYGRGRILHEFSPALYKFLRYNSLVTKKDF